MVVEAVRPLKADDEVAKVMVGPVCVCPVGPIAVIPEPPPPPTQVPFIAKHPPVRLIPPVVLNVEVAVEKLMPPVLPTERSEPGVVVPIPKRPEESITAYCTPPAANPRLLVSV